VPKNAIRKAGVFQIFPAHVVERLGAIRRAHAVHLHNDEAKICERRKPARGTKTLRHERPLRTGVNLFDDRIFFCGIEVAWPADDSPDIGLAIAPFRHEHLGRLPGRLELGHVGFFELAREFAVRRAAQFIHRRQIDPRPGVNEVLAVR
jgi:hypothetical protein